MLGISRAEFIRRHEKHKTTACNGREKSIPSHDLKSEIPILYILWYLCKCSACPANMDNLLRISVALGLA